MRPGRVVLAAFVAVVAAWMIVPTLMVVPLGFTNIPSFKFPPPGWSTQWYAGLKSDPTWLDSFSNSIQVALIVALCSTVIGSAAAFGLVRGSNRIRVLSEPLIMAPMIAPTVVAGIGMYRTYLDWHLSGTSFGFVVAHSSLAIPLVVLTVSATLRTVDRSLEQAAMSLGAGPVATFRQVTLPLILPGVLVGALFAFMTSFDEVVVSSFLATVANTTLPVLMYTNVTREISPSVAAVSTLIFGFTLILLLLVLALGRREERYGSNR